MTMPRLLPILLAAAATVAASASLGLAAGMAVVSQKGRAFGVREVEIARGDVVRFTNDDTFLHQIYVRAPALTFNSPEQEPGQSVDVRFPASGTFEVRCEIHPRMLLAVTVR